MAEAQPEPEAPADPRLVQSGFIRNVLPALLWAVAIFVGGSSGMPQPSLDLDLIPFDKVNHTIAFCGMQVLAFRALRYELPGRGRPALLWSAALIALWFGIALEVYQSGLPDRSAEVADAVADGIGAAIGATVLGLLRWP